MVLVDTSFIVDLMRGDPEAVEKAKELEESSGEIHVPMPVIFELWEGIERSETSLKEEDKVMRVLDSFLEISFDKEHAKIAGRKSGELVKEGVVLDPIDLMVGAMSICEGEALVTRDEDFEKISDTVIENY